MLAPEYQYHWKITLTPGGRESPTLRASGRLKSGSGFGGWPTPKGQEDGRTLEQYEAGRKRGYEKRKGKTAGGPSSKLGGLAIAAQMAGWPTPKGQRPEQAMRLSPRPPGYPHFVVGVTSYPALRVWQQQGHLVKGFIKR